MKRHGMNLNAYLCEKASLESLCTRWFQRMYGKDKTWRQFVCVSLLSYVRLFATLWTVLSLRDFSSRNCHFSSMGVFPTQALNLSLLCRPALQVNLWPTETIREAHGEQSKDPGHQGLARRRDELPKHRWFLGAMKLFCLIL